jgi:hypothetical protein
MLVPIPEPSYKELELVATFEPVAQDSFHLICIFAVNHFRQR